MRMSGMDARELGISVVSMGGKDNWKPYARVLEAYRIPFVIVLDKKEESVEADIRREQSRGNFKSLLEVFRLSRGNFEDYLSLDVVAAVFNEVYPGGDTVQAQDFDESKSEDARLSDFRKVLHSKKPENARYEFDKIKIGVRACKKMADAGQPLHPDYIAVFDKVREEVNKY
jgi:hypothetical protein